MAKEVKLNKTLTDFNIQLRTKPLDSYSMDELQVALSLCYNYYNRFKKIHEREVLAYIWNKLGGLYNAKVKQVYPQANEVYPEIVNLNLDIP